MQAGLIRTVVLASSVLLLGTLGDAPRPAEAAGEKALDEYFAGKVIGLDEEAKVVTLRYDFRSKKQAKDWIDYVPFRIKPRKGQKMRWYDDKLEIIGNSGARHKGDTELCFYCGACVK